ncbi:MAG: sulfotransferase domain-containing protein [Parvibaculum sp.]|uniref:sulfotransferase domain-containing protein n=1 Tax=Parvibaculum sp. TaxID=2024848 RepID=UPI0027173D22|nr:sulfotransferase domain-containing protein [Parvibaculum sp.]MDO8837590.1 sulfotransferase domain-containing protein [Parvibaculum sp.]
MGALVWLASYPKSGNTWMRAFLFNLLRDLPEPADINRLDTFSPSDSARAWYEPFAPRPLERLDMAEVAKLRPAGHRKMTRFLPDPVFVKTHNYLGPWFGVPLHTAEVTAGAVYIVRNPLDLVLSLADHFGMTVEDAIDYIAKPGAGTRLTELYVPQIYMSWSTHVESWTAQPRRQLIVLRYEDLLAEPVKQFEALTRFLGIAAGEEKLTRAIRNSSFGVLRAQEEEAGFKERSEKASMFFRDGRAAQWRDKLTPSQIARIVRDHRKQMERFGYVPADYV